ncbi:YgaP family membrane protein [Desulfotomaculum sp. 1211_IL3151]|uniref:YgaP family membrane protein n=1 Tax=Desulfotomaculum sp. 1211_IL3151 TaxID=3084055 RepID=UPI002FD8DB89
MIEKNAGTADRILRATFGVLFLALGSLGTFGALWSIIFLILGIGVLVVAATGFSPLYRLLGYSSLKPQLTVKEDVAYWTTGVSDTDKK